MNIVEQNLRAALHLTNRVYVVNNGQIAKARLPTSTLTRELPKDTSRRYRPQLHFAGPANVASVTTARLRWSCNFFWQKGSLYVVRASDSEAASAAQTHGGGWSMNGQTRSEQPAGVRSNSIRLSTRRSPASRSGSWRRHGFSFSQGGYLTLDLGVAGSALVFLLIAIPTAIHHAGRLGEADRVSPSASWLRRFRHEARPAHVSSSASIEILLPMTAAVIGITAIGIIFRLTEIYSA